MPVDYNGLGQVSANTDLVSTRWGQPLIKTVWYSFDFVILKREPPGTGRVRDVAAVVHAGAVQNTGKCGDGAESGV